jgi:hypothetical protein
VPAVIVKLIEAEKPVAVFPPASCAVTTGCVPKATPDAELLGPDENTNFVAALGVTLIAVLTAEVTFGLDAVSVKPVPTLSILQPPKVATPLLVFTGFAVHVRAAPAVPVPDVIVSVTEATGLVTVFPAASSNVTTGCWPNAVPPVALELG